VYGKLLYHLCRGEIASRDTRFNNNNCSAEKPQKTRCSPQKTRYLATQALLQVQDGSGTAQQRENPRLRVHLLPPLVPVMSKSLFELTDVFRTVMSDWLSVKDLTQLDTSVSGARRQDFLSLLTNINLVQPFYQREQIESWWKHHKAIFKWMALRKLYKTQGMWSIHEVIWKTLYNDTTVNYRPILEQMRIMRFENYNPGFDFNQFSICRELRELEMYNLDSHEHTPITEHVCPKLEKLFLQGCTLSKNLMVAFARCNNLRSVQYFHNNYIAFSSLSAEDRAACLPYFQRLQSFTCTAGVNEIVTNHFPEGNTSLQTLYLDNVHRNESNTQQLLSFLARCPHVTDLTLARCRFNFALVLKKLRETMKDLKRFHLNHCRWLREENEHQDADLDDAGTQLSELIISTALPMFNEDLDLVLKLCAQNVSKLRISFCARLKPPAYTIVKNRVPYLRSFTLDYSEEDGYFTADHMNAVQEQFHSLPFIQVNKWQVWLTAKMMEQRPNERTVMYEVNKEMH
jgi:hypothetical protein